MIGSAPSSALASLRHDGRRPRAQRPAGEAAGFVGVRLPGDAVAAERGVRGDHAVDPVPDEEPRDAVDGGHA